MVLVLPIITVWYFRRPSLRTFEIWFLRGLFLALIIVTVVASKHGSGTHYFWPLVPISTLGLFFVLSAPSEKLDLTARQLGTAILLSLLVSYAPGELIWTKQLTTKFATLQTEKMKLEELQDFYKKYALK